MDLVTAVLVAVSVCLADGAGLNYKEITATQPGNSIVQKDAGSMQITCSPHFTPDQLARSFEPEFVNCYGYLYEDTTDVLETMCIAIWRHSGNVIQDYESLSESICPLWNKRTQCLWKFISARCTPSDFATIAEIRRTSLITVAKEALCNDSIKRHMDKFLELGGARCFCSDTSGHNQLATSEFIKSILNCISNFYNDFPLAGIPYETFKSSLEKAKVCGAPLVQDCLPRKNSNKSSEEVGQAFEEFIDGLALAQAALWKYRDVN